MFNLWMLKIYTIINIYRAHFHGQIKEKRKEKREKKSGLEKYSPV
jgi:hypothetical protein